MNRFFFFKDLDSHYVIGLLGIRFCIKHKCRFKYKDAVAVGINNEVTREPKLIISLTSYPARIKTVHLTINTLLQQTLKPDKIILWLAKGQFNGGEKDLPENLLKLKKYGLSIEWCDEDIKSYKKLIPALEKYPEDIIITCDDDVYYSNNMLASLYNAYLDNPNNIYVKRSVKLCLKNGLPNEISTRKYGYKHLTYPSYFNQMMGGSGCLYPPKSLYKDCINLKNIKNTVPTHDDAYFWAMAVLNNTKIQVVDGFNENLYFIDNTQDVGLMHINKSGKMGISLKEAYKVLINKYPEILKNLEAEVCH